MSLLEALPGAFRRSDLPSRQEGRPRHDDPTQRRQHLLTRPQRGLLVIVPAVLLAGVLALVFGPGRGLRTDVGRMNNNLAATRTGIYSQLDTSRMQLAGVREQLQLTAQSLAIQQQGLETAVGTQQDTHTAASDTSAMLAQTKAVLATVQQVTAALGGPQALGQDVAAVVQSTQAAVQLARTTLAVAQRTLATGRDALAVARDTLATLHRSEVLQQQLLDTARQTLEQTREINRKIPGAPVGP